MAPDTAGSTGHGSAPATAAAQVALTRTVRVPACAGHNGFASTLVTLLWECPQCGAPRGEVFATTSYDGSRRLACDGWTNPCGHVDKYDAVRREAGLVR